ncbi:outer membrane lipoprotein carrier protein LolA [Aciduricibacillus chroicocephali]|uniref:Outer membrane lipoprotein carrier protein LolA n=1 Tax=Aciduricibacillus chroicocephali TaxID=3054939 RepID=A0ABY9KWA3_9BACI|nr:outer membrane lipoprotein carrier protein LolA [Bacillaceae bacterium 44XB]
MRKKHMLSFAILLGMLVLFLAGCGEKSKEDVVKKLDSQVSGLKGYKSKAEMKMNTGESPQKYDLDVWYKEKEHYRVSLANVDDEKGNQIILKNADGVFVVTPALNKSFKFQSDWPESSSQPYLYQSLVQDVKKDKDAEFKTTEKHYIFITKTNYQSNSNLPYQEIRFNKKNFTPELVRVLDKDKKALVEVSFSEFKLDPSFKAEDFALDQQKKSGSSAKTASAEVKTLSVAYPVETSGAALSEKKEIELENGKRVILTYSGDKEFTLVQENAGAVSAMTEPKELKGDIVNLGHTLAALNGSTIEWSQGGVDYKLASDALTKEELINVAKSVHGTNSK